MKVLLVALALCAATLHAASPCSNATVEGEYGLQFSGIRPSAPGGPFENVIGIVLRRYDGAGNFTETHTVKGSINGVVLNEPGAGTYQINEDCTGSTTIPPAPSRPFPIVERFLVVSDGDEMIGLATEPALLVAGGPAKRISSRNTAAVAGDLAVLRANIIAMARRLGMIPR